MHEEIKGEVDTSKSKDEKSDEEDHGSFHYIKYDYKLVSYECEFYHFDFMRVVQLLQRYLNEPTAQDLIKSYRQLERARLASV